MIETVRTALPVGHPLGCEGGTDLTVGLRLGDREPRADCKRGELIDRIAAGPPVRKLLLVQRSGMCGCHSPGIGLITVAGSIWPQSTRIVQRKRLR